MPLAGAGFSDLEEVWSTHGYKHPEVVADSKNFQSPYLNRTCGIYSSLECLGNLEVSFRSLPRWTKLLGLAHPSSRHLSS